MRKMLNKLQKKDKSGARNPENSEGNIKPREWTRAELSRWERILPALQELQATLPVSKDGGIDVTRDWWDIQVVASAAERMIEAIIQDNQDIGRFRDPEATLGTLISALERLKDNWGYSRIYQALKQEVNMNW
jgi:hypothetical protein